ncbi:HD domain-containing phosphohydrolase [uncultured Bilophila sp.]|uniref:response regulator n=1 Tax=uncultured Bilophila sp. TaxID=529385 RepID=UPI0025951E7E|nr:HD domain-containing phosphohydrolase [uncultured Bilophila sp.]
MGYPKKPVVLVVDDTIANIRILDDLLRGEYTVRVATNGATALRLALSEPRPDIVLLDIMMPDMDGYEVCRRLKSDPLTSNIAVVFITAMGNEEHEAKGLDLGAVDFIAKPFQPRLVRARVSNHVALKKYNDELNSLVKERTKELYLSRSVTVECLASVVETRDNETGAHVRRTQHGVEILAKRLRLMRPDIWDDDDDTIELFRVCAPLHDVGKVGIPDSILRKPGKLTEAEFNEMKKHTTLGYQTLSWAEKRMGGHNDFLRLGAVIAYTHHERWDGKGYPRGLKGEEIPRVGRLMALADVYDALISKRVYKPAFDHETARDIIVEGRGTQFDPLVVEAFLFEEDSFRSLIVTYPDDENPLLVSND